jgi:L-asparaginase/Glu-tRNA(Gln) amidotransferase subunit D
MRTGKQQSSRAAKGATAHRATPTTRDRLLLIDIGGTIGEASPRYRRSPWRIEEGEAARLLSNLRTVALRRIADFDYNMFVTDEGRPNINPCVWLGVAKVIYEHKTDYAGFVVTHGTDTLSWAAATISFALRGLSASVIVTGAILPLTRPGSDGWRNLVHSFLTVRRGMVTGVAVAFGSRIMHGCRVWKLASSGPFDAFESPAIPALGRTGTTMRLWSRNIRPQPHPPWLDESRRFYLTPRSRSYQSPRICRRQPSSILAGVWGRHRDVPVRDDSASAPSGPRGPGG